MKKINKKNIDKQDLIDFAEWSKKNGILFSKENFLSDFLRINLSPDIPRMPKKNIEFYVYNKFVLGNTYHIETYDWIMKTQASNKDEFVRMIWDERFKENKEMFSILFDFFYELNIYKRKANRDYSEEMRISKIYWEFLKQIEDSSIERFNKWILYINKTVYQNKEGFKR